jgi:hypothetical membrane protein
MTLQQAGAYPHEGAPARLGKLRIRAPLARRAAWVALAGQLAFVAAWIVGGALEPGYSHFDQGFSELGARNAAHPALMNAGYLVLGVSFLALSAALWAVLPARPAGRVAAGAFAVSGLAVIAVGLLPVDCGLSGERCLDAFDAGDLSWQTYAHVWVGLVFDVAFVITPFALARALWPRHVSLLVLLAAATALPILVGVLAAGELFGGGDGLAQRLGFVAVHVWAGLVAVGVLSATRSPAPPGALIPMRPRDFFGRAWTGRGELTFWPPFLWGRAPRGFEFRRTVEWVSDEVWLAEDRIAFDDGEVEVHRMVAQLAGPDRIHVMGDDVPGGADLLLEEGGYRMTPYRFAIPIGPVRFALRPRDEVRPAGDDGTLEWTIRFRWFGLPVARLRGLVRPHGDPPGEA